MKEMEKVNENGKEEEQCKIWMLRSLIINQIMPPPVFLQACNFCYFKGILVIMSPF